MTPWEGLSLSESSFTSIPRPPRVPPAPRSPHPPCTPPKGAVAHSHAPSSPAANPKKAVPRGGRRRPLPLRRSPRPPLLRPVTQLSFSRNFTFSFFQLPLHQSPRGMADRARHLSLQLRQIHY